MDAGELLVEACMTAMGKVTGKAMEGATPFPGNHPDPLVSILVISYNTRQITIDCIRSVIEQTSVPYQLIVFDNASRDGSAEAIAAEFPGIQLIASEENHGFAKGNNVAAELATAPYLLLLNPDTVVLDRAIDKLMDFAKAEPQALIWGGKTLKGDRTLAPASCWREMTVWNIFCRTTGLAAAFPNSAIFNSEAYGGWDREDIRQVDIVAGCYLLLPTDLWRKLGGFNLSYIMYGDEADLCARAIREFGAKPMVTNESVIVHYGGASEPVRADKMVKLILAKMTIIRHHFSPLWRPLGLFLYRREALVKATLYGLAARLTGKDGAKRNAAQWSEIWARRAEWWNGYAEK